jgi:hypothetical protein
MQSEQIFKLIKQKYRYKRLIFISKLFKIAVKASFYAGSEFNQRFNFMIQNRNVRVIWKTKLKKIKFE